MAENAIALVDEALDIGNEMPEDIHHALRIIANAAIILDAAPRFNDANVLQRYMDDLKAIEDMLDRGAASIADGGLGPQETAFRQKVAGLLRELKAEVANAHRYRANQLPPPCRIVADGDTTGTIGDLIKEGLRLLKLTPSSADDAECLKQKLESVYENLENIAANPDDIPLRIEALNDDDGFDKALAERNELIAGLGSLRKNIETRMAILKLDIELNPLSRKTAFEAKAYSTAAAIGVIDRILIEQDDVLSDEQKTALMEARAVLSDREAAMARQTDGTTLTKHDIQAIMGSKGKYAYRSTAKMEKKAPAIAARLDAIVRSIVPPALDGNDGDDPFPSEEPSGEEHTPLLAAEGPDSQPDEVLDPSGLPLSSPEAREEHIMTTFLDKLFTKLGIDPGRKLEKLYRKTKIEVRDSRDWANISRPVQLVHGDRVCNLKSELTPQAGLRRTSGTPVFPELVDGETGAQDGVNCHQSADYRHPTNLAQTRLLDESGKELFNATRHGTLSAYDISPNALREMDDADLKATIGYLFPDRNAMDAPYPDGPAAESAISALGPKAIPLSLLPAPSPLPPTDEELQSVVGRIRTDSGFRSVCTDKLKKAAAISRAREVALAALASHPEKLRAAEAGRPISISINTISLLTPDTARGILGWFRSCKGDSTGGGDELAMVRDQYEAWNHIRRNGIDVGGPNGRKVHVDVEVNDFNFGVNDLEFLFGSSDRDEVRARNTRAMQAVIGELATDPRGRIGGQVGEWLKAHPYARTVETLAYQVADLWHTGAWRRAGAEPYKLVTRLAVLTHMIGAHADFNCKSGKDRTGELDIEAKHLAWLIEATGEVPQPDTDRDDEQRGNFYRLAMESGNIELQKLNTGLPGYKLKATKRLAKFLGYFKGGRELMSAITLDRTSDGKRDFGGESIRAFQGLASFEGS
ncbi:inositol phosphate phosphatase SopB [Pseudochelatococcus sp. B33]